MTGSGFSGSELGEPAADAFSVLSNETRLLTLLALWEAYDPFAEDNAVPFSELYDRVDIDDTGNFNYHLDKLSDGFITRSGGGYELSSAGLALVQTVVAGSAIRSPELEATEIDKACPHCGAPVRLTYTGESIQVICTECSGWFEWEGVTEGGIMSFPFPPAGLRNRSPKAVLDAMIVHQLNQVESMMDGVCPTCAGRVEMRLDVCESHDVEDGICEACDARFLARTFWACATCKNSLRGPGWAPVLDHPAVVAFFYDHGIEHAHATWAAMARGDACREELVCEDPIRMRFTLFANGDELAVTVDDSLTVVDIDEG